MTRVAIGIGSNVDPEANLKAAAALLREKWPDIRFASVYRTAPLLEENQEAFLNAIATFETDASPEEIQTTLQSIERQLKKDPPFRFGPRTIDLDILLFGDESIETESLTVPHPRMHERRFVLEPLMELIDPTELHPVLHTSYKDLLKQVQSQECERTDIAL